jgi:hypothetical protein
MTASNQPTPELAQRPVYKQPVVTSQPTVKTTVKKRTKKMSQSQVETQAKTPVNPMARPTEESRTLAREADLRLANRKKIAQALQKEGFTDIQIDGYQTVSYKGATPTLQGHALLDGLPVVIGVTAHKIEVDGHYLNPAHLDSVKLASGVHSGRERLAAGVRYGRQKATAIALNAQWFNEPLEVKTLEWVSAQVKAGNYHTYKADGSKIGFGGNDFQGEEAIFLGNIEEGEIKMDIYQVKAPVGWLGGSNTRFGNFPEAILFGYWKPENYGYGSGGVSTYRTFPRGTVVGIISASVPTPHYAGVVKFALIGTDLAETQERVASLMQRAQKMWEPHQ